MGHVEALQQLLLFLLERGEQPEMSSPLSSPPPGLQFLWDWQQLAHAVWAEDGPELTTLSPVISATATPSYCQAYVRSIRKVYREEQAEEGDDSSTPLLQRRSAVRSAISHAWRGYWELARGADELRPVSGTSVSLWHNAATIFDSLDTLWLAGLRSEFRDGLDYVASHELPFSLLPTKTFEYHIRLVGGLLAAYEVSGEPVLLDGARRAADAILVLMFY